MAEESTQDAVWNAYIDTHNFEPSSAQQLLNFSKKKVNNVTALSFSNARKTYNRNKGKGRIENQIDMTKVSGEEIDDLLNEIEEKEVYHKFWRFTMRIVYHYQLIYLSLKFYIDKNSKDRKRGL